MLLGGVMSAVVVHLVPLLTDERVSRVMAVGLASALGLAVTVGRVGVGALIDRFFAPVVAAICILFCALALHLLQIGAQGSAWLLGACVVMLGFTAGSEMNFLNFLTAQYFGLRAYAEICGWLLSMFALGTGFAPLLAGLLYEHFHGYGIALQIGTGLLVVAAICFATLGRYSEFPQSSLGAVPAS